MPSAWHLPTRPFPDVAQRRETLSRAALDRLAPSYVPELHILTGRLKIATRRTGGFVRKLISLMLLAATATAFVPATAEAHS
ncbi:hypothetical protein SB772_05835 [Paraburkholderia sp. SIMBA_030]